MNATRFLASCAAASLLGALAVPVAIAGVGLATDSAVTYIDGDRTRAAFVKGAPLIETDGYKVHASRREAPGMAEIHTLDTDIIYVLEGTATIVTGGRAVNASEVAPHEIRGASIDGGSDRRLAKGDVFIVPNGVPHWFRDVQAPFLYYVVKTTLQPKGGAR